MNKKALQEANAAGDDRQLWPHGFADPHYWYSVLDGLVLLRALRRNFLDYQGTRPNPYNIYGNDPTSSHRENVQSIFVADPYEIRNFSQYLNADIRTLTGTWPGVNANRNNRWEDMPQTLIIPVLIRKHWCCVRVLINYQLRTAEILWDDPYGSSHFPLSLRVELKGVLFQAIQILIRIQINSAQYQLTEINVSDHAKGVDQQGVGDNAWDCGPIIFSNICDYIKAITQNTPVQYTVQPHGTLGCLSDMLHYRERDAYIYREEIGEEKASEMEVFGEKLARINNQNNLSNQKTELKEIESFSPYWIDIFHTHIISERLQKDLNLDSGYTEDEITEAVEFVRDSQKREADWEFSILFGSKVPPDPFDWHLKQYKDGILLNIEQLDDAQLIEAVKTIILGIEELQDQQAFAVLEETVRSQVHQHLCEYLQKHYLSQQAYDEEQEAELERRTYIHDRKTERDRELEEDPDNAAYIRQDYSDVETSSDEQVDANQTEEGWPDEENSQSQHSDEYTSYEQWLKYQINQIDSSAEELESVDLQKLVKSCGKDVEYLLYDIIEYNLEVSEQIIALLNAQKEFGVDPDIVRRLIHATCFNRGYLQKLIGEEGFIAEGLIFGLQKLIDDPTKVKQKERRRQIIDDISLSFARASELIKMDKYQNLKLQFNDAYYRRDWVTVQKLWAVFAKFQCLLQSTAEHQGPTSTETVKKVEKKGKDYTLKAMPKSYDDLLRKAWASYGDRAESYYYRVYLDEKLQTLQYGSHTPNKIATTNIQALLGKLEEVGVAVKKTLKAGSTKDTTNILAPVLCFVITDKPHAKHGDHRRIFIPVAFDKGGLPYLLSKDSKDGIFTPVTGSAINFKKSAISDYTKGLAIIGEGTRLNADINTATEQSLNHSERVLIEALRVEENIGLIITLLQKELEKRLGHPLLEEGQYKVYAVALLTYSTNSVCRYCTPSLIALANSYDTGFLALLTSKLNSHKHFKTRGFDPTSRKQDPTQFRLTTIVTAEFNYTEQANDLPLEIPTDPAYEVWRNPDGRVQLPNHTLDLKAPTLGKDGKPHPHQRTFFEFVAADFSERSKKSDHHHSKHSPRFFHAGHLFMSGSKEGKLSNKTNLKVEAIGKESKKNKLEEDQRWHKTFDA